LSYSNQSIISYLVDQLKTISDLTNAFDCIPLVKTTKEVFDQFSTDGENFHAFEVTNFASHLIDKDGNIETWRETFHIDGWIGYKNSTTKQQTQTWCDAIKSLLCTNKTLDKRCNSIDSLKQLFFDVAWLTDVFCHRIRIELIVIKKVAIT